MISCSALLSCRTKWLSSITLCWCMVSCTALGAGTRRLICYGELVKSLIWQAAARILQIVILSPNSLFTTNHLSIFSCRCLKPRSGFFRVFNFVIQIPLVGHSMAGFSALDAMERFHRILKVYISAVLLPSGKSFANSPSFCEMVCLLHPASLSLSLSLSLYLSIIKTCNVHREKNTNIKTTKTTTSIVYQATESLGTHSINCLFPDSVARSTSSSLYSFLAH
jgi:hypothetical protein